MTKFFSNQTRVWYGGQDLSGETVSFNVVFGNVSPDCTTIGEDGERFLNGLRQHSLEWSGIYDSGTGLDVRGAGGNFGTFVQDEITVVIGTSTGLRTYSGEAMQISILPSVSLQEVVMQNAELKIDGQWRRGVHFGTISSYTATAVSSSLDNQGSSTNGAHAFVHCLGVPSNTCTAIIEHSTNGSTFVTLITVGAFTAGGSQKGTSTGSVFRYARFKNDGTGTGTFGVSLSRG